MNTLVIGPFTADRVALDGNALVSGMPPVTALGGLSDTLARRLGRPAANWPVALILHDLQPHDGRPKPKPDFKGRPGEAVERVTGWIRATVVLLEPDDTLTSTELTEQTEGLRIAGGMISPERPARVVEDLGAELRRLPPGHILVDRTDVLDAAVAAAEDPLDGLLDVFTGSWDEQAQRYQNPWSRDEAGQWRYLVPVAVGHQALEPMSTASPRKGTRCPETPHLFSEGIASVAELVSARKAARAASRGWETLAMFWRWTNDPEHGVLRLQGHHLESIREA